MDSKQYLELITPAMQMVVKKGEDYNQEVDLHDYFPLGDASYIQMLHMKVTRLRSLTAVIAAGKEPNFEGIMDTVNDLLNYTVFYLDYLSKVDK